MGFVTVNAQEDEELILRVAMQDDIRTTNPLNADGVWTWNVIGYIYGSPINTDEDGNLMPYIAVGSANLSTSRSFIDWDDCTIGNFGFNPKSTWADEERSEVTIFYDFENVFWHDGHQMNIQDVLFSYHVRAQMPKWTSNVNCLKDKGGRTGSNFPNDHKLYIDLVWKSPDRQKAALKFTLQEPFADFFTQTLSVFLLPEHIWGTKSGGQIFDETKIFSDPDYNISSTDAWSPEKATAWNNPSPVGSGPFTWDFWNPTGGTSQVKTFRNHFYRAGYKYDYASESAARQPNIDAILFKIYKTAEAAVLALRNNDVDYIAWSIPPTFVGELANEPGVTLMQSPEQGFFYLSYNMRKPSFGYADYATFPYYAGDDVGKPLRRAIAHCIDKVIIVRRYLLSFGTAGDGPIHADSEWYNASIPKYNFNPDKAIEILREAGYKLTDGPGSTPGPGNWWLNPDGSPIGNGPGGKIEILTPQADYDPYHGNKGLTISKQMQEVGIYAESVCMDFGSIVDRADNRDFDMYMLGWRIGSEPTDFLHAFFHSSNAVAGQNYPGYQNKSFDDLIDRARATADAAERKQLIFDAQAAIAYDLPYDVLYYRTNIEAYRSDNFVGWEVGDSGSIFNWKTIYKIHAPTGNRLKAHFVNPPSAIYSNSTISIDIVVKNQDRVLMEGAEVTLNASRGSLDNEVMTTSSSGRVTIKFTAPFVERNSNNEANGTTVILQIKKATFTAPDGIEYDPAPNRLSLLTVFPEGAKFLSVKMYANPDVIDPDVEEDNATYGFTYIDVIVKDQNGDPAVGVMVAAEVDLQIPSITPKNDPEADHTLTDSNGVATFILISTNLPDDDDSVNEFRVYVRAISSYPDVSDGDQSMCVYIVDKYHYFAPPNYNLELFLMGAMFVFVMVGVILLWEAEIIRRRYK